MKKLLSALPFALPYALRFSLRFALPFALLFSAGALPAHAADAGAPAPALNRYAATIAPAERFDSGVLRVERHGNRGRALILVPGLASGAWAWQSVVRDLAADYTIYVVTLPGFDGRPLAPASGMASAIDGLRQLVASRKLEHPVLIGHSLGAVAGFALAEQAPDLLGGLVAIDGLPVFPGTEALAPGERAAMAAGMAAGMVANMQAQLAKAGAANFARQQQAYMRTVGVRDMAQADQLAQLSARSDPAALGMYAAQVMALDLRAQLNKITVPILALVPYFDQDPVDARTTPAGKAAYYQSLMAGAARLQVVPVADARHFVMFDQPQVVNAQLRAFLAGL